MSDALYRALAGMKNNPIRNYIAPGLTSWLIGAEGCGRVRLFTADRDTREWITPHSHRFGFTCLVLRGFATNILFEPCWGDDGNRYVLGVLKARDGGMGGYEYAPGENASQWKEVAHKYGVGETYAMTHDQIHSIQFSRDAAVLFLEGPEVSKESSVLEPWSDGKRVPTFETRDWMFQRPIPMSEP